MRRAFLGPVTGFVMIPATRWSLRALWMHHHSRLGSRSLPLQPLVPVVFLYPMVQSRKYRSVGLPLEFFLADQSLWAMVRTSSTSRLLSLIPPSKSIPKPPVTPPRQTAGTLSHQVIESSRPSLARPNRPQVVFLKIRGGHSAASGSTVGQSFRRTVEPI